MDVQLSEEAEEEENALHDGVGKTLDSPLSSIRKLPTVGGTREPNAAVGWQEPRSRRAHDPSSRSSPSMRSVECRAKYVFLSDSERED